ncbi:hypothetical protein [Maribellus maritimus]|uniref:hypothetical protein n=1 Tax=Maribellus maritimus TaxID=2870838 RepID=UPI001EEBB924|nr:hypothetical protein [Maribellus maritimus]MCG6186555.1 hypothetical protein [Maribellus maritimus]
MEMQTPLPAGAKQMPGADYSFLFQTTIQINIIPAQVSPPHRKSTRERTRGRWL